MASRAFETMCAANQALVHELHRAAEELRRQVPVAGLLSETALLQGDIIRDVLTLPATSSRSHRRS
jgi:hypothetical protein